MDTIRYEYASNYDALDEIQRTVNDVQSLREEVRTVFEVLSTVYEGDAAEALQQRHIEISNVLDQVTQDITATRTGGNQQQEDIRALDHQLASRI
jgi:uncharacterized protein YukE